MSSDRWSTMQSLTANETQVLDRGASRFICADLVTHADDAETLADLLNERPDLFPEVVMQQHPRQAGRVEPKVAGKMSGSEH